MLFAAYLSVSCSGQTTGLQQPDSQSVTTGEGQKTSSAGVSTGGVFAPVLDANHQPITMGGFDKDAPQVFTDVTAESGLGAWRHMMGTSQKSFIIEANGSGVALLDYDNDGWLDIYLVNGSTYGALRGKTSAPHAALFHNNHDGTFTNVAAKANVTNDRWGFGAAVADFDNDGYPDIYVSNFGPNRLYHNNHDGTFTDVAAKAHVTLGNWSTGATWGDYDNDGRVDLFVPGYVHYDVATALAPGQGPLSYSFCTFRGTNVMCGPHGLTGERDHLFHNNGDGTFTDVSLKAGVDDKNAYFGLSSAFVDVNNDGKLDLVVADDSTPNYLYLNKGDGTFEDVSYGSGFALNENGRETASMGLAIGDYRNNGLLDICNTTFSDDYNPLYRNDGDANFTDVSYESGLADVTIPFLGWGDGFFDFDNDGWKDLFFANGHVYPEADKSSWGTTYAQKPLLFRNIEGKKFSMVPAREGSGLGKTYRGRGLAFGDLFNTGHIDVVINNIDGTPTVLRNVNSDRHHWIEMKLVGGVKSPRDAIGAVAYVTTGSLRQRADVISGASYASTSDPRLHFGLGDHTKIDELEIRWPSGMVEKLYPTSIDRILTITEGKGIQ